MFLYEVFESLGVALDPESLIIIRIVFSREYMKVQYKFGRFRIFRNTLKLNLQPLNLSLRILLIHFLILNTEHQRINRQKDQILIIIQSIVPSLHECLLHRLSLRFIHSLLSPKPLIIHESIELILRFLSRRIEIVLLHIVIPELRHHQLLTELLTDLISE